MAKGSLPVFNIPTILGSFSLLLLLAAIASAAKLLYGPAARRLDGQLVLNPAAERSSKLLLLSLGLSVVAATFAVIAYVAP